MRGHMRRIKLSLCLTLAGLLMLTLIPPAVNAAMFELPVTIKAAFDKMTAAADRSTSIKLSNGYSGLLSIQKQEMEWDEKINKLHYNNEEKLLAVRQRIKDLDAAKLIKLEDEIKKTEKKYEQLFSFHSTLTNQLKVAKSAKNKTLTAVFQAQVNASKIAVQLAKDDIKMKKTALKEAKSFVTKKTKAIKTTLAEVDKLKVKIRASKSTVSSTNKQFTSETNALKTASRNSDATNSVKSLSRLTGFKEQIIAEKKKMFSYEEQIAAVIVKANKQF